MAQFRIVVTDDRHHGQDEERAVLREVGGEVIVANCATPDEVAAAAAEADGVLCDQAPMPAEVMPALRRCRVISRYGVGCDNVDLSAAAAQGIWVANVPDYCVEDVSDQTLALLLACMRRIPLLDREVRAGHWNVGSKQPIYRLQGKTYGLIGYGLIARAVHRKLRGFEFARVLVHDPFVTADVIREAGGIKVELDELCQQADALSIHVPLNDKTRGMIGKAQLAAMKPTTILINVARGPVVDEAALVESLRQGRPMCAGLDVFAQEPPAGSAVLGLDSVVLSDHVGYFSRESFSELKTKAARNIAEVLCGRPPIYPVNRPVVSSPSGRGLG
jgi:D-3-phosphoglycerate dehydrogenase / 2-oxoglutarate reductase